MTPDHDINRALSGPQVSERHFVQKLGKRWLDKANLAFPRVLDDAQARLKQSEERTRRPSLRRAGNGVACRSALSQTRKAAKKLRQPLQIEIAGGLEKSAKNPRDFTLGAVARKAQRNQRVVVRPDRTVVIGHRVVAQPRRWIAS